MQKALKIIYLAISGVLSKSDAMVLDDDVSYSNALHASKMGGFLMHGFCKLSFMD